MSSDAAVFWSRVDRSGPSGCWLWIGEINAAGYGVFRKRRAHRWSYESSVGPIPAELVLDHLCRVRHCVNPAHLEPVTIGDNVLRGQTVTAANRAKTHCVNGHPFDAANTVRARLGRNCRTCRNDRKRRARTPRAPATHCARGHEFTPENTITAKTGRRNCRECKRKSDAVYRASRNLRAVNGAADRHREPAA